MFSLNIKLIKSIFIGLLLIFPVVSTSLSIIMVNESLEDNIPLKTHLTSSISQIDVNSLPDIDYDELNRTWYDSKIEMLIITPDDQDFVDAVTPLMKWKNQKGVKTIILRNYSAYSGIDDAEKIRNMIKYYHERENIQWVLLAGDAEEGLIPIRYVYNPDLIVVGEGNSEYVGSEYYKPTDFYYSDLDGSWDEDNDGNWGENSTNNDNGLDEIDWIPDVYVGRLPADNAYELSLMINKTLKYEKSPEVGEWMNRMLLAGGVSSFNPPEDEARLTEFIWQNFVQSEMNFTHLHRSTSSFTPLTPPTPNREDSLSRTNFRNELNMGYSTILFAGHGSPWQMTDASTTIFLNSDASNSNNFNMTSLIYSDACSTSSYDMNDNNIGEILMLRPDAGTIGYIGGLRITWYLQDDFFLEKLNRGNAKLFWKAFFEDRKYQQGMALYDSKVDYLNSKYYTSGTTSIQLEWQRKNVLTYNLLGDPELDVYTGIPSSIPNYFSGDIYEGQLVNFTLVDNLGRNVPRARVHLYSDDGKYFTTYADINGSVRFRLPLQANESYNVVITGHNLIPSNFTFTTLPDIYSPEILSIDCIPDDPSVSNNICFEFYGYDNQSGIEGIYLMLSELNANRTTSYQLQNGFLENRKHFTLILKKLVPGDYSYLILVRDYSNKSRIYTDEFFNFTIQIPFTVFALIITISIIIGITAISIFKVFRGIKKLGRPSRTSE